MAPRASRPKPDSVVAGLALVGAIATGCAIVPIPTGRHVPWSAESRGRITDAQVRALPVGAATRQQTLLALGEPDRTWSEERFLYYKWTTASGYWAWLLAGGYQGVGGAFPFGARDHDLLLEFDSAGVLRHRASIATWGVLAAAEPDAAGPDSPMGLRVGHLDAGGHHRARLVLSNSAIEFADEARNDHDLRLEPGQVRVLRRQRFGQVKPLGTQLGCVLEYTRGAGQMGKLRVVLQPEALLVLRDFVRRRCPGARFAGD